MRTVESVLREFGAALDLPSRQKVLLLRELRADFEGAVATLVAGGASADDARVRALRLLSPTAADADSLTGLHRPRYAQLVGRLPVRLVRPLEWVSIVGLAVVGGLSPLLVMTRVSDLPAWAGVLLAGVTLPVVVHLSWHAFRLFVRQDMDAGALARAGATQAGLIALALSTGMTMVSLQAYGLFGSWADGGVPDVASVTRTMLVGAETTAMVLAVTMVGVVGVVVLVLSLLSIRDAEREIAELLGGPGPSEGVEPT